MDRGEEAPPEITGMFVDEPYQRAGIAMEMLLVLSSELGTLRPGKHNQGRGGENALTEDGEALTRVAQIKGYVYPFPEEHFDEDD